MTTPHSVVQDIILHEVIAKRQKMLDQLAEGLNGLTLLSLIRAFPEVFLPLFVSTGDIFSADVIEITTTKDHRTPSEEATWNILIRFIYDCSNKGTYTLSNTKWLCTHFYFFTQS